MAHKRHSFPPAPAGKTLGPRLDRDILRLFEQQADDPQVRLAQGIFTRTNMAFDLQTRNGIAADINVFNNVVSMEGSPVTNQGGSGRCWIFSSLNILRIFYARKYNLAEFQLSQSYLFFYDHLSKGNKFFEDCIELADRKVGDRALQCCFQNAQIQDGGDFDLAVSLIEEFGLVPQSVYPESFNSTNSFQMDEFLNSKLREWALDLRAEYRSVRDSLPADMPPEAAHKAAGDEARKLKTRMLKQLWKTLAICCGTPPRPDSHFEWETRNKNGDFVTVRGTPLEFARSIPYTLNDHVVLLNDPRNAYGKIYTIKREGIVVGGRPLKYINVAIDLMKEIAIAQLQSDVPCWFSCDIEKAKGLKVHGIIDTDFVDFKDAFGTKINMTKAERLNTTDSSNNHALILTGVHLDDDGRPVRWKVENSWGPEVGNGGFFVMTDSYFTEYVYEIAVPQKLVPRELVDKYYNDPVIELEMWDALA